MIELFLGNYDIIQQPKDISETAKENIPFYMFIDEETEAYMKNSSVLDNNKRVGLWRIVIVHNIPYTDARRNGKVSFLCLFLFASPSVLFQNMLLVNCNESKLRGRIINYLFIYLVQSYLKKLKKLSELNSIVQT